MTITYTTPLTDAQDVRHVELARWGMEHLSIATAARPRPGPHQVLVQMKAISLNFRLTSARDMPRIAPLRYTFSRPVNSG